MCKYYAHWIKCPNEDIQRVIYCPNNHDEKVREAHDAICKARLLGKQIATKEIKHILNPNFDKNNQEDIDDMELSEECLRSYPKKPNQQEIRKATEKERKKRVNETYLKKLLNRKMEMENE